MIVIELIDNATVRQAPGVVTGHPQEPPLPSSEMSVSTNIGMMHDPLLEKRSCLRAGGLACCGITIPPNGRSALSAVAQ